MTRFGPIACRVAGLVVAISVLAGCSSVLGPRVTVINDTDQIFTIEANETWVGTVGPHARATLPFPLGDGTTEVWAKNDVGHVLVSIGGTRAMWDDAIEGTIPMSGWQTFDCGRILIASEPFDESVPGPFQNPCP